MHNLADALLFLVDIFPGCPNKAGILRLFNHLPCSPTLLLSFIVLFGHIWQLEPLHFLLCSLLFSLSLCIVGLCDSSIVVNHYASHAANDNLKTKLCTFLNTFGNFVFPRE